MATRDLERQIVIFTDAEWVEVRALVEDLRWEVLSDNAMSADVRKRVDEFLSEAP